MDNSIKVVTYRRLARFADNLRMISDGSDGSGSSNDTLSSLERDVYLVLAIQELADVAQEEIPIGINGLLLTEDSFAKILKSDLAFNTFMQTELFYKELANKANSLKLILDDERKCNTVLSMNQFRTVLFSNAQSLAVVADHEKAMNAIVSDSTILSAFISNTNAMNAFVESLTALEVLAESGSAMQAIASNSSAASILVKSEIAMNFMVYSKTAISALVNNSTSIKLIVSSNVALNAIVESDTALEEIAESSVAMNNIASTSGAVNIIMASQQAMALFAASNIAMAEIVKQSTACSFIGNSKVAMSEIVKSEIAMNAVVTTTTAITNILCRATGLSAVIESQMAIDIVAQSHQAVDNIIGNSTTAPIAFDSDALMNAFVLSDIALNAMCLKSSGSQINANVIINFNENYADVIYKTIAESELFNKTEATAAPSSTTAQNSSVGNTWVFVKDITSANASNRTVTIKSSQGAVEIYSGTMNRDEPVQFNPFKIALRGMSVQQSANSSTVVGYEAYTSKGTPSTLDLDENNAIRIEMPGSTHDLGENDIMTINDNDDAEA